MISAPLPPESGDWRDRNEVDEYGDNDDQAGQNTSLDSAQMNRVAIADLNNPSVIGTHSLEQLDHICERFRLDNTGDQRFRFREKYDLLTHQGIVHALQELSEGDGLDDDACFSTLYEELAAVASKHENHLCGSLSLLEYLRAANNSDLQGVSLEEAMKTKPHVEVLLVHRDRGARTLRAASKVDRFVADNVNNDFKPLQVHPYFSRVFGLAKDRIGTGQDDLEYFGRILKGGWDRNWNWTWIVGAFNKTIYDRLMSSSGKRTSVGPASMDFRSTAKLVVSDKTSDKSRYTVTIEDLEKLNQKLKTANAEHQEASKRPRDFQNDLVHVWMDGMGALQGVLWRERNGPNPVPESTEFELIGFRALNLVKETESAATAPQFGDADDAMAAVGKQYPGDATTTLPYREPPGAIFDEKMLLCVREAAKASPAKVRESLEAVFAIEESRIKATPRPEDSSLKRKTKEAGLSDSVDQNDSAADSARKKPRNKNGKSKQGKPTLRPNVPKDSGDDRQGQDAESADSLPEGGRQCDEAADMQAALDGSSMSGEDPAQRKRNNKETMITTVESADESDGEPGDRLEIWERVMLLRDDSSATRPPRSRPEGVLGRDLGQLQSQVPALGMLSTPPTNIARFSCGCMPATKETKSLHDLIDTHLEKMKEGQAAGAFRAFLFQLRSPFRAITAGQLTICQTHLVNLARALGLHRGMIHGFDMGILAAWFEELDDKSNPQAWLVSSANWLRKAMRMHNLGPGPLHAGHYSRIAPACMLERFSLSPDRARRILTEHYDAGLAEHYEQRGFVFTDPGNYLLEDTIRKMSSEITFAYRAENFAPGTACFSYLQGAKYALGAQLLRMDPELYMNSVCLSKGKKHRVFSVPEPVSFTLNGQTMQSLIDFRHPPDMIRECGADSLAEVCVYLSSQDTPGLNDTPILEEELSEAEDAPTASSSLAASSPSANEKKKRAKTSNTFSDAGIRQKLEQERDRKERNQLSASLASTQTLGEQASAGLPSRKAAAIDRDKDPIVDIFVQDVGNVVQHQAAYDKIIEDPNNSSNSRHPAVTSLKDKGLFGVRGRSAYVSYISAYAIRGNVAAHPGRSLTRYTCRFLPLGGGDTLYGPKNIPAAELRSNVLLGIDPRISNGLPIEYPSLSETPSPIFSSLLKEKLHPLSRALLLGGPYEDPEVIEALQGLFSENRATRQQTIDAIRASNVQCFKSAYTSRFKPMLAELVGQEPGVNASAGEVDPRYCSPFAQTTTRFEGQFWWDKRVAERNFERGSFVNAWPMDSSEHLADTADHEGFVTVAGGAIERQPGLDQDTQGNGSWGDDCDGKGWSLDRESIAAYKRIVDLATAAQTEELSQRLQETG